VQAQVPQKSLLVKNIFNSVKNFRGNSVFQGKRKFYKILNVNSIFTRVEIFRATLFFSRQAQVAQKSWTVKKLSVQCIFTWGRSVKFGLVQTVISSNIVIGCSDSDLDQGLVFCENRTIGCR